MKKTHGLLTIITSILFAALLISCSAERNNPNDPGADNYDPGDGTISDGARTWRGAEVISGSESSALPDIAMSESGNAMAVWVNSSNQVLSKEYAPDSKGWSNETMTVYSNFSDNYIDFIRVSTNQPSNSMVAWAEDDTDYNIDSNFFTPNGGWQGSAQINEFAYSSYIEAIEIALFDDNDAVAAWIGGDFYLYGEEYFPSNWEWSALETIQNGGSVNSMHLAENGGSVLVCYEYSGGIYAHYYDHATYSWWGDNAVSITDAWSSTYSYAYPRAIIDDNDTKHLICVEDSGGVFAVVYSKNSGSAWDAPLGVSEAQTSLYVPTTEGETGPQIGVSSDGKVTIVIWLDNSEVYARTIFDDGNMSQIQRLDINGNCFNTGLVVRDDGSAIAVWGQDGSVKACHYSPQDNAWGGPVDINGGTSGDISYLKIVMDDMGNAIAIWCNNATAEIFTNRYN